MKRQRSTVFWSAASALLALACTKGDGIIDDDGTTLPDGPISVDSLGSETLSSDGVEVTLDIRAGAASFALVAQSTGSTSELILAETVTTPSGEIVFDFENDISINRTDATNGLYTMLVPTNPAVTPEEGEWVVKLRSGSAEVDVDLSLVMKTEPATDRLLDLNLYFVGLDGMDAASAETDEGFQAILGSISSIFNGANVSIRAISYNDITGGDADTYGVIDSDEEIAGMYQLAGESSEQALNVYFVNDIALGAGGLSVLGLAGGVPGPPVLQGTRRSGVTVNMGSYLAVLPDGDQMMIDEATAELEIIMAHESGHFLGLYHTVERNGLALPDGEITGEDPLSDTTTCPDTADADMDGLLSPAECAADGADNLMFWSPANDSRALTAQQGQIVFANPLIH